MPKKITLKNFLDRATKVHGQTYDYSKVEYIRGDVKVCIVCPIHGEFWMSPNHHYQGEGCPKCRYIKSASSKRRTINEVIEIANTVHNFKYDYSLIKEYKNDREKLPIVCKEHGVFYQTMNNHIKGKQGCPECGKVKCHNSRYYSNDDFIKLAVKKHNNFYLYDKVKYVDSKTKVTITCPVHGDFEQIPRNHIYGAGCPRCFKEKSSVEREVLEFIKTILSCEIVENDRTILDGKELDIFIPSLSVGIEINGLIWHSEKFGTSPSYHVEKTDMCLANNIRLIHIFEDEWNYKQEIVKSRLKTILKTNATKKIYARKCLVQEVPYKEAQLFLDNNHIQGNVMSKYRYGLYYDGELVSLMTFGSLRKVLGSKHKENSYELLRFCNKLDTIVVGGASKLFKHFLDTHKPCEIISYADRRWSNGHLYNVLGFELSHVSPPNYFYVVGKTRQHRFAFRKNVLVEKYGCPKEMTEHEFCLSKGWYRIYDCGCLCYRLEITNPN